MVMKELARGAEAVIYLDADSVRKERPKKNYRHPVMDEKIRKLRTRHEARIIGRAAKAGIPVPKIFGCDECEGLIVMEHLKGKKLRDVLAGDKRSLELAEEVGESVARLHKEGIIHGDLTTSNMILHRGKVFFIDFGLGFHSDRVEDKAVDLHLLKRALESRHWRFWEKLFEAILKGYFAGGGQKQVVKQMETIGARGRYRHDKRSKKKERQKD